MKPIKYIVFFKGTAIGAYNSRLNALARLEKIIKEDLSTSLESMHLQQVNLPQGHYNIIGVVCYDDPDVGE